MGGTVNYQTLNVPPWRYQSTGPYTLRVVRLERGTEVIEAILQIADATTLGVTLGQVERFHLPPQLDTAGWVTDVHNQVVFGWIYTDEHALIRVGTEEGHAKLAEIYDPALVAIWEVEAQLQMEMELR
jgi:hypothetical protein